MDQQPGEVTRLLIDLKERKREAAPKLFQVLYAELRRMAQRHLRNESHEHTLQATAIVHEVYLRLVDDRQDWQNRAHFFGIASSAMRRVLVDHARAKHAAKRPSSGRRVNLDSVPVLCQKPYDDVIAIDRALEKLSRIDSRQGRIVELKYFGGLTTEEVAEAMCISTVTVERDWVLAKAWLRGELTGRTPEP